MLSEIAGLSAVDLLTLASGIVALVVSLYAATSSRRSADAAERAALAAQEAVNLERERVRETWIEKFAGALPDGAKVTGLLADLPVDLKLDWIQLVDSAAMRNPRTPKRRMELLFQEYSEEWASAAGVSTTPEEK